MPTDNERPLLWYAVRVKPNFEKTSASLLEGKGYEVFLPTYHSRRQWSDRLKELDLPLFPGYVFCRLEVNQRLPVLTTPGVMNIIGVGKTPMPVPEEEIAAVQTIVLSRLESQPWPFLKIGQRVRIEHGPLAGVEGILTQFKSGYRLVVSISLLQRSVATDIEGGWVTGL